MRRALTIIVMVSLLGGQVGMLGALLGRHQAQQQMQHRIETAAAPDSSIQHLTLSRADRQSQSSSFVRIDDHEFRYQGRLYDVVREEWRGSEWHVWVVHDREEERYLDALAQALKTPMLEGESAPAQEPPVVLRPIALVPTALAPLPTPTLRSRAFPLSSVAAPPPPYLEVPHPPPWGSTRLLSTESPAGRRAQS